MGTSQSFLCDSNTRQHKVDWARVTEYAAQHINPPIYWCVRLFRAKYQGKASCPKQGLHFITGQRFALINLVNNVWYLSPWHVAAFQQLQANKHDAALLVTSTLPGAGVMPPIEDR